MAENPKRIHLLGSGRHEEMVAAAAITPGMLLAINSAGKVVPHPSVGGAAERLFALEDALQGRTIANAYASGELVSAVLASPGDVVYAWASPGSNLIVGDKLQSDGGGRLMESVGPEETVAVALEPVNLSATGSLPVRIRVRVL